jgi:outer membrane protein assembly factor BamB
LGGSPGNFGQPPAPPPKQPKGASSRWDSPWLFAGGTVLGLTLIAFVLLLLSLTRGNAAQMFQKAEEQYNAGSYSNAYAAFDKFAKNFPKDPQAPMARIRRGMSRLRQASDGGKNPREALKVAKEVLPELVKEGEAFNEARLELASILPEIADQFATQAKAAQDVNKRQELVKLTDEALELVNLPDYIPPNLRNGQQSKIDGINEKLLQARRTIDQEQESASTLAKIQQLVSAGQVVEAYQVRTDLLKRFPGLERQTALVAATSSAAAKEKELVRVVDRTITPTTDEPEPPSRPMVLYDRQGQSAPGVEGRQVAALIQGAVYGFDAQTGKALWRRFVGLETTSPPQLASRQPGADIFAIDSRDHSLLRLEAATGKLQWRLPVGEPFVGPTLAGERLYLATAQGQIIEVEAASGHTLRAAQLPQELVVPPTFDPKRKALFQMGKHSTLFVLAADTLACEETLYLGHKATGVAVPPIAAHQQLLIFDNAGTDFSWLHFYSTGEAGGGVKPVLESIRLKGRVVTPPGAYGSRVVVVTDLGEIVALDIDATNTEKPVQIVGREAARLSQPHLGYQISSSGGQQLWVASGHLARYDIQTSLQQLGRKWVIHNGDEFLAPLQLFDKTLLHVRKQAGAAGVTVEACNAEDGKAYWSTQVAAPMAGLNADPETGKITAISSRGSLFELSPAAANVEARWRPPAEARLRLTRELVLTPNSAVCLPHRGAKEGLLLTTAGDAPQVMNWSGEESPAAAPIPFQGGLLVPLRSGRVQLVDLATGKPQILPFMPPLEPGQEIAWTQPAVLASQPGLFFIADQKRRLFRVGIKDQPVPHLTELAQGALDTDLIAPLIAAGDWLYSVVAGEEGDVLVAISPKTLTISQRWLQPGRCTGGPWAAGDAAVISLETGELICAEGGQIRWTTPPADLQPAGAPLTLSSKLIVTTTSGKVQVIDRISGQFLASAEIGEPLGAAVVSVGQELLISGSDGVVHRLPMPGQS